MAILLHSTHFLKSGKNAQTARATMGTVDVEGPVIGLLVFASIALCLAGMKAAVFGCGDSGLMRPGAFAAV